MIASMLSRNTSLCDLFADHRDDTTSDMILMHVDLSIVAGYGRNKYLGFVAGETQDWRKI